MCTCCPGVTIPKIIVRYVFLVCVLLFLVLIGCTIWFSSVLANDRLFYAFYDLRPYVITFGVVFCVLVAIMICCGCLTWFCAGKTLPKVPFGICACIMWLAFFLLAVLFIGGGEAMKAGIDEACDGEGNDISKTINEVYTQVDSFYATGTCPVYPAPGYTPASPTRTMTGTACGVQWCPVNDLVTSYNNLPIKDFIGDLETDYISVEVDAENTDNNADILACKKWPKTVFKKLNQFNEILGILGEIEAEYDCSGVCTKQNIYYFSDTREGEPDDSCKDSIKNKYIQSKVTNYGIGFIVMALFIFLPWILNFVLCCLPGKGKICRGVPIF